MANFDYIIIGAGSAGAALANRLSADPKVSVLVLEAGPDDRNFWIQTPIGYGKVYYDDRFNWKYTTEPCAGLDDLRSYWPRGKVLGGSSSINAMVYVRGHHQDFDEWGAFAPGWSWDDVAPIYQRMESWQGGADDFRGATGPLPVSDITSQAHPLSHLYLTAAAQAGFAATADYNGAQMEGSTLYQITTQNGKRASASRSYLWPVKSRRNLNLQTHAHVTRIIITDGVATGVTYRQHNQDKTAQTRGEVILCGGSVNSPQLLQLSGIGEGKSLQSMGIDVQHHNPNVGQHLSDHLGFDHLYRTNVPTLNKELRPLLGKLRAGLRYLLTGTGPLALSLNQGGGFIRMMPDAKTPDLQLYFSPVSYTRAPVGTRPLMNPDPFQGFLLGFNPCKPTSRGHLTITKPDPFAAPEIHPNYLSTDYDRRMMLAGSKVMDKIASSPALTEVIEREISPGPKLTDGLDLETFIAQNAWTVFHPCGTCRMGQDANTNVVDARLRVHGIGGLRVADASIFPTIPTGNTNAPAIMVGERASDLIAQDAKPY